MNIYILYGVTALGVLLSLFWMLFMFLGKSISSKDDGPQIIKLGTLEVKTNSVLGVLTASLVTAVLPLCLQFYLILAGILPPAQPEPETGEPMCKSLIGHYKLHFNYIFGEKDGMRLIARRGELRTASCESSKEKGIFILKGEDTTDFDIEVLINGKYELVATGTFDYPSQLRIGENGKLISRTFDVPPGNPKLTSYHHLLEQRGVPANIKEINGQIDKALELRAQKHIDLVTKSCDPAIGKLGGRDTLALICQDYTRVMVMTSD
jgi:hypothetical protein